MSNNSLVVCDTFINQDAEGRYYLNALHKAAGNDPKDAPAQFFRNDKTTRLIELLKSDVQNCISPINVIKGKFSSGIEQGTYVVKPLVYAYAMWISPEFHLHVINAYDALVTQTTLDFEFLKPITEPITLADFEWRHQVIMQMLQNLKKAEVNFIMSLTGEELLARKCLEK
jgi:hypothetical protein